MMKWRCGGDTEETDTGFALKVIGQRPISHFL